MEHPSAAKQPISLDEILSVVLTYQDGSITFFSSQAMTPFAVLKLLHSLRLLRKERWFVTTLIFHKLER